MWDWAHDGRIRAEFEKFTRLELWFLILTVALWTLVVGGGVFGGFWKTVDVFLIQRIGNGTQQIVSFLLIVATGILLARKSIFSWRVHWPIKLRHIYITDWRIYAVLGLFIAARLIMFWLYPEALPSFLDSMKLVLKQITFLQMIYIVLLEEVSHRLVLYYSLNRLFGRNWAFWLAVTVFSLGHSYSIYYIVAVTIFAAALPILTIATGSLIPAIGFHFVLNALSSVVIGFL